MRLRLTVLRGAPGAGKSTLARQFPGTLAEADQFFIDAESGRYTYDPTKLAEAHGWCQARCQQLLAGRS